MWYKIDFDKLILLLLPTFLRKPILFGFIKALISPISLGPTSVYSKWLNMRRTNLEKLSYNCQRCHLRGALNDRYDFEKRRIIIGSTLNSSNGYIYTYPTEIIDTYLGVMYLKPESDYSGTTVDYIVRVPREVYDLRLNEITALIDFYNLAGKKYAVVLI